MGNSRAEKAGERRCCVHLVGLQLALEVEALSMWRGISFKRASSEFFINCYLQPCSSEGNFGMSLNIFLLLVASFRATNEDGLLGFSGNLLFAVTAFDCPTSGTPKNKSILVSSSKGFLPRGSLVPWFATRWRKNPAWDGEEPRGETLWNWVDRSSAEGRDHELLACLPGAALVSAGVLRFVLTAFMY